MSCPLNELQLNFDSKAAWIFWFQLHGPSQEVYELVLSRLNLTFPEDTAEHQTDPAKKSYGEGV